VREAMVSFYELEIVPLQQKISTLNDFFSEQIVTFEAPKWAVSSEPSPAFV
jgi:hypothetical protein